MAIRKRRIPVDRIGTVGFDFLDLGIYDRNAVEIKNQILAVFIYCITDRPAYGLFLEVCRGV